MVLCITSINLFALIGLDFKVLDTSVDFYILNLMYLNDCTDQFKSTGVYPLTGDTGYNTVVTIRCFLLAEEKKNTCIQYLFFVFRI